MKLIQQGAVTVDTIYSVLDTRKFKVWEIDLHAKYAGAVRIDSEIHLYADERTIKINDALKDVVTIIDTDLSANWLIKFEVSKHTLTIISWKENLDKFKTIYEYYGDPCENSSYCQE